MTATSNNVECARRASVRSLACAGLLAIAGIGPAAAENVLNDIRYTASPSGAVEVTLQLAGPASDANVFTTDDPPRVAIDLPETRNAVAQRRITVGSGATSAITALEANGRTRVVVDLFRPASFESRAEGNALILKIGDGGAAAVGAVTSPDPAKRAVNAVQVTNLDFRRGDNGAGRVIVRFSGDNVSADMIEDDSGVVVRFGNVAVPAELSERLDVTDFATPVQQVELQSERNGGATLALNAVGKYETLAYQTGNEYVIEVTPIVEAVADAGGVGVLEEIRGYKGTPVTFNFQNIPVRTVLQLIAEESGLNIVAADSVAGSVTLRLVNVPWDQALEIVLRAKGLDQRRDGNVVWIAPQAEIAGYEQALAEAKLALEQRSPLVTEYISINYGSAEEIATLLTDGAKQGNASGGSTSEDSKQSSGFLSQRGSVSFDRRTNTLLLNDTADKIIEIKALIALLDRPVDQVLIEARIVVATETFARELGARFGISGAHRDSNGTIISTTGTNVGADRMANIALANRFTGGTGLPVAAPGPTGVGVLVPALADRLNVNLPVLNPAGSIGFAILGADYLLDLELSALEQEGRGEVVSSPRVITANQREATIKQGDEVGYVTVSPVQGGQIPIPNVQFKEVLLQLTVTPTITQDGRVYMVMAVKKDEVSSFVDTSIGQVPQISTREVSTAVLVDNAQTVVVGGVYEFSSRDDLNKVPFLGDVPVLGNLFRKKGRSTEKAELLIFVTPKILAVKGSER